MSTIVIEKPIASESTSPNGNWIAATSSSSPVRQGGQMNHCRRWIQSIVNFSIANEIAFIDRHNVTVPDRLSNNAPVLFGETGATINHNY